MKFKPEVASACLAGVVLLTLPCAALALPANPPGELLLGQSFVGAGTLPGVEGGGAAQPMPATDTQSQAANNLASNDPASKLCAEGTHAIDQGRWADALKIFTQVANAHGEHADGALYWKAYAENKLGDQKAAAKSCTDLRAGFPKSRWVDDCGALEVELHAKSGQKVQLDPNASDDVKLLALNAMLHQNEALAMAEIQEILKGDSSEKLKKEAQFILGTHYSDSTYAQVVRISYVEGDVRIQRGQPNGKPTSAIWEKAVADVPLETGFSVATGDGRAEIEFENASTIYLAPNSVLTFNDLHETAGIPFTELGLLSGTVSLYFHPYMRGEKMILHTPTNDLISRFPDKTYARVESFTDALTITPLEGGDLRLPGVAKDAATVGKTWTWLQGQLVNPAGAPESTASAAWDEWTINRVKQRNVAVNSVLAASGLSAPIPGMADMAGKGHFFDCAPYGTCWEPNDQAEQNEKAAVVRPSAKSSRPMFQLASYSPTGQSAQAAQSPSRRAPDLFGAEFDFPCTPASLIWRLARDPITGQNTLVGISGRPEYSWAVCHAGSWIRHKKHYVWVAGGKRHHIDPVRWVKSEHKVGFVPIHPYDVKDRPALNAQHEVFVVSGKNPIKLTPTKFDDAHSIGYLKAAPKEYSTAVMRPLAPAEAPRMEAHAFLRIGSSKDAETARTAIPIHFDPHTASFLMARQQVIGGKTTTVMAPLSNHNGSLQAHSASFTGSSGFHGGGSSGGGAGAHGGGGGNSGGGGGSHGGGSSGGGSSSGGSSASSGASSGGGSHH